MPIIIKKSRDEGGDDRRKKTSKRSHQMQRLPKPVEASSPLPPLPKSKPTQGEWPTTPAGWDKLRKQLEWGEKATPRKKKSFRYNPSQEGQN